MNIIEHQWTEVDIKWTDKEDSKIVQKNQMSVCCRVFCATQPSHSHVGKAAANTLPLQLRGSNLFLDCKTTQYCLSCLFDLILNLILNNFDISISAPQIAEIYESQSTWCARTKGTEKMNAPTWNSKYSAWVANCVSGPGRSMFCLVYVWKNTIGKFKFYKVVRWGLFTGRLGSTKSRYMRARQSKGHAGCQIMCGSIRRAFRRRAGFSRLVFRR